MAKLLSDADVLARQQANARSIRRRAKERVRQIASGNGHDLGPFYRSGGDDQIISAATCRHCRRSVSIPDRSLELSGLGILSAQCVDNIAANSSWQGPAPADPKVGSNL